MNTNIDMITGNVNRKNAMPVLKKNRYRDVEYLTFPLLDQTNIVNHLFSTRIGGVSKGIYSGMNLSYTRGDLKENVDENFRQIAEVFESMPDRIVCTHQTHTVNIRLVTESDSGKGITKERDYSDTDGLITNTPGMILAAFFADCVPLYFVDTQNKAIGLSHSGWRGTVHKMGAVTLKAMMDAFGTKPEHVTAAIGPSICRECYEIGEDVAAEIRSAFGPHTDKVLIQGEKEGKYKLDLWRANAIILQESGIPENHIQVTDICTCCNSEYLFSHRASKGRRGNLGAFMELRKS